MCIIIYKHIYKYAHAQRTAHSALTVCTSGVRAPCTLRVPPVHLRRCSAKSRSFGFVAEKPNGIRENGGDLQG